MSKKGIDFSTIWKSIHGHLNSSEEESLNTWLENGQEARDYYEDSINFYNKKSVINKDDIDVARAKGKVTYKVFLVPKLRRISQIAAVFIFIASVVAGIWFAQSGKDDISYITAIEPGTTRATLVLSDGSRHSLEGEKDVKLEEEATMIVKSGKQLNYKAEKYKRESIINKLSNRINTLKIPRGGEFLLTLVDGTKVWLNAETILRYPLRFNGNKRKVELIGEAYFEVAHEAEKPFIVEIEGQEIEVLGTTFNISAYPDQVKKYTTLVEGSVKVHTLIEKSELIIVPGQQIVYDSQHGQTKLREVNVRKFTAWKDGRYMFDNESLEEMMFILSRWYDFTVQFNNDSKRHLSFTGNLKRTEKFEDILTIIENTNEVKFKIDGKKVIIY